MTVYVVTPTTPYSRQNFLNRPSGGGDGDGGGEGDGEGDGGDGVTSNGDGDGVGECEGSADCDANGTNHDIVAGVTNVFLIRVQVGATAGERAEQGRGLGDGKSNRLNSI